MTQEQQKILEQFNDSTIIYFLKEIRHKAFISWGIEDIIDKAKQIGFEINEEIAIDIIASIDKYADCNYGITWETLDFYIEECIDKHTYVVDAKETSTSGVKEYKICALNPSEHIENWYKDDEYYFYGIHKGVLKEGESARRLGLNLDIVKIH